MGKMERTIMNFFIMPPLVNQEHFPKEVRINDYPFTDFFRINFSVNCWQLEKVD
jgi:hypothetical protein